MDIIDRKADNKGDLYQCRHGTTRNKGLAKVMDHQANHNNDSYDHVYAMQFLGEVLFLDHHYSHPVRYHLDFHWIAKFHTDFGLMSYTHKHSLNIIQEYAYGVLPSNET
ncbi:hypothetical protein J7I81_12080 [Bacillus sp. ISL-32]|nr:hypothetical protein [Bacillus sp. ISL-32]